MTTKLSLVLSILLLALTLSHSRPTRPESSSSGSISDQLERNSKGNKNDKGQGLSGGYFGPGFGFGSEPGTGFKLPGSGDGGEYSKVGIVRPTVVCKEKGHCYMKKLTCPAKCYKPLSRSGKGYGGGGGGGGCTVDCKKKCVAYC